MKTIEFQLGDRVIAYAWSHHTVEASELCAWPPENETGWARLPVWAGRALEVKQVINGMMPKLIVSPIAEVEEQRWGDVAKETGWAVLDAPSVVTFKVLAQNCIAWGSRDNLYVPRTDFGKPQIGDIVTVVSTPDRCALSELALHSQTWRLVKLAGEKATIQELEGNQLCTLPINCLGVLQRRIVSGRYKRS